MRNGEQGRFEMKPTKLTRHCNRTGVHRKNPRETAGFTMIELVIALLVGLILTGMAIPQVRTGLYSYRLKGAAASSVWAVQSTRYQALMEGYPYQVVFSQANQNYQVQNLPPGSGSYANVGTAVPLSGSPITLNQDTTLQFRPNGSVTATVGALSFVITYQGKTATLTVSNYGNVSVVYN
jgi:prepilin-type N-terminal cleavage/methylation domain-containing protein